MEARGAYADIFLDKSLRKAAPLTPVDRSFITELVYGTLRWRGRIDWVIGQFSKIPIEKLDSRILNIIRLGVYQLLFLDRVPSFAAVNESVKLAELCGHKGKAGFVNANLRAIERGWHRIRYPDIDEDPELHISVVHSHPIWMVKRWIRHFGVEDTIDLCMGNNEVPPLTLRTNTLKVSRQELLDELRKDLGEISPTIYSTEGITIRGASDITALPSFDRGWFQVQDEAAQLISHLLNPMPGQRVLDACAAPGGKTTHLAQLMENRGDIYALDINAHRLSLLQENCRRLGVTNVKVSKKDASRPLGFTKKFHRILVDAPCSGMGVLRRNPDSKWNKKERDIDQLRDLQLSILNNLADYLTDQGILLYVTCTISPEENEGVVTSFMDGHREFVLESISEVILNGCDSLLDDKGFFHPYPYLHNMDGLFAARLKKLELLE